MPQSLSHVVLHFIWSTKERYPFLHDKHLREELYRVLEGISAKLECPPVMVGGVADHIHILVRFSRTISIAEWVKEMKRASTKWLHAHQLDKFYWQKGYGVFSVSQSALEQVCRYIATQEEHHKTVSFQDEYRAFLKKHNIAYDENYLWE